MCHLRISKWELQPEPITQSILDILNRDGASLYVSKGFKEIKYTFSDKIMVNARNGKK